MDKAEMQRMISDHAASVTMDMLWDAMDEGGIETADGCWVEADGRCPHGFPSPMRAMGMI